MIRRSSLSNRGTNSIDRDSVHLNTVPSQPRYVRAKSGLLKYIVDIDLRGVPKENLRVSTRQNVVLIDAKYDIVSPDGDKSTHEVVREIHVPLNVDLNTVRCVYTEPGVMTIEAEASDPIPGVVSRGSRAYRHEPTSPTRTPFHADPRRVTFMEPTNTNAYSDEKFKHILGPMRHLISPPPHFRPPPHPSSKRMSYQARCQSFESKYASNSNSRAVSPQTIIKNSDRGFRSATPVPSNSAQLPKLFRLRVEIGSHVDPNELNITRQNGLLVVHARRYVKNKLLGRNRDRLVFEHRSEHTIPNDVDVERLSARLENGIIYVDAPYLPTSRSIPLSSPKTRHRERKASDAANNWYSRPR